MNFNSFRFKIFFRLILLVSTAMLAALCLYYFGFYYTTFIITVIFFFLVVEFFRFANKTNKDLNHFLLSIKYGDYSQKYAPHPEKSLRELRDTFNMITQEFQRLRTEKEENHFFLQHVIEHVPVSLICYEEGQGKVILFNQAAKRLTGIEYMPEMNFLGRSHPNLFKVISSLGDGQQDFFKFMNANGEEVHISVRRHFISYGKTSCNLIMLQNLRTELEVHEIEIWQKFVRIITHEIMNSITPISSLSATLKDTVNEEINSEIPISKDTLQDVKRGLEAIGNRCSSLSEFVETYRRLTRLPSPKKEPFKIRDLFDRIQILFSESMLNNRIDFNIKMEHEGLELFCDIDQLEQAIINLIKNAVEVLQETTDARIQLAAYTSKNRVELSIYDNGKKIPHDMLDKIFMPFFSTKEKGSGIGLTLTRQLVINNNGSIMLNQQTEVGKTFILKF
ncbi:MAG TPA: ATP-binding protein [Flavobacteriales bacterium]|nr:ATP-binding protein [Flavobacteriales bacterium]